MSLSPGFPHGAPTLAEVLLSRTFARPPRPFVDGEFLEALEHADDTPAVTVAIARPSAGGPASHGGHGAPASGPGPTAPSSAGSPPGKRVDVRA